jgi:hypothetical protein
MDLKHEHVITWSWGGSVSLVLDYRLGDLGSIPAEAKDFPPSLCVETSSEIHPASCTVGTGGPFTTYRAIGFDPRQKQRICPLASVPRPALKATRPPIPGVGNLRPSRSLSAAF